MEGTEHGDWIYDEEGSEYILRTDSDVRLTRVNRIKPYAADWLVPFGDVEADSVWYILRFRANRLPKEQFILVDGKVEIPKPAGPHDDLTISEYQYYLGLAVNPPGELDAALKKARIRVLAPDD